MPRGKDRQFAVAGTKYGFWTVIGDGRSGEWLVECECGTRKEMGVFFLQSGRSKSCGCRGKDWCRKHGMEGTQIYSMWAGMIQRCTNPRATGYSSYGARGVTVSPEWRNSFEQFFADMGPLPSPTHTIGRKDNARGYSAGNCRWETKTEQVRNRSITKFLTVDGETRPLAEWAEHFGIRRRLVAERIRQGWDAKRALTTPARYKADAERFWENRLRLAGLGNARK